MKKIISFKYGIGIRGWCLGEGSGAYGISLWKFICQGWDGFHKAIRFRIGNGS